MCGTLLQVSSKCRYGNGNAISGAVKTAVNFVLSKAIGIINGFIGAINAVIGVINKIPGVSLSKISKLGVPQLERGGVLAKGQVGLLEGNGRRGGCTA